MTGGNDTIAAVATGQGGAIAVIRVSGGDAIAIVDRIFVGGTARSGGQPAGQGDLTGLTEITSSGNDTHPPETGDEVIRARSAAEIAKSNKAHKSLADAAGYTVHFGEIRDPADPEAEAVDEVLATVFRAPHSYTGEDSVEISCHASPYIENRIMQLLSDGGARSADPGEFTIRAFLAGKLDLAQAEAVADLIASSDRAQHSLAMGQMRGGVSSALGTLRDELVTLASLLELELDFGEEDVQFADRGRLHSLTRGIAAELDRLAGSFSLGNVIKEGVPVAIVGRPNAGKSTLLNTLVGDDRAMVSEIAGTTRDRIEERVNIDGLTFRFIDTAGLRATDDVLEQMGIDRTLDAVAKALIVLLIVDGSATSVDDIGGQISELGLRDGQRLCVVVNKIDKPGSPLISGVEHMALSAKTGENVDALTDWLRAAVDTDALYAGSAVVSNTRHYEALVRSRAALERVLTGLGGVAPEADLYTDRNVTEVRPAEESGSANNSTVAGFAAGSTAGDTDGIDGTDEELSSDLLAEEIREALHHLGTITGEVTTDEILGTIFSKFCIGK